MTWIEATCGSSRRAPLPCGKPKAYACVLRVPYTSTPSDCEGYPKRAVVSTDNEQDTKLRSLLAQGVSAQTRGKTR